MNDPIPVSAKEPLAPLTVAQRAADHDEIFVDALCATLPRYVPDESFKPLAMALAPIIREYARALAAEATQRTLNGAYGDVVGPFIYAYLTGTADRSDDEMLAGRCSRANASKQLNAFLRNSGLPIRCPERARPKRKEDTSPKDEGTP